MPDIPAPSTTAARALFGALIRTVLKIVGTAMVTHGLIDRETADSLLGQLAEEVAGALLLGGASAWSFFRARLTHTRLAAAWRALNGGGQ